MKHTTGLTGLLWTSSTAMSSKAKDKQLQELVVSAGIQYRVRPVGLLCTEDRCHLLDAVEAVSALQEVKTRSSACWSKDLRLAYQVRYAGFRWLLSEPACRRPGHSSS